MTIQYASDLHLEFESNNAFMAQNPLEPIGEVLILAGDITYLDNFWTSNPFFDTISDQFEKVYLTPGNHEFYQRSFDIKDVVPTFKKEIRPNVSYLNNQVVYQDDVRVLFTTLWTSVEPQRSFYVEQMMNDFRQSVYDGEQFRVWQHNKCHASALLFLEKELAKPFKGKTVVVSHHVPFRPERCQYDFAASVNDAFHVDLERLFYDFSIDCWIHGHNHWNMAPFRINETMVCTNQLGYVDRGEHLRFRGDAVVEV